MDDPVLFFAAVVMGLCLGAAGAMFSGDSRIVKECAAQGWIVVSAVQIKCEIVKDAK